MSKLPKLSGPELVKVLSKHFGFEAVRQKGSHIVLRKFKGNEKIVVIVPAHDELKTGTMLGILQQAGISRSEFLDALS
jgi:predicted RNA binding protein YcfA (HicA-like mRNA interferase family)